MSVIFLRTIIIYIIVVLALRIMGKRQIGELEPSELVVTILVSNLATMSIEDSSIPLLGTIMPIFTLVCCEVVVSYIILKNGVLQRIISGNPRIIMRDGVIDQKEMRNLRWSVEDLIEQLHINGVFDLCEVSYAIVETSGALSVYQKCGARPLTPESAAGDVGEDSPPMILISDGKMVKDAVNYCGVTQEWIDGVLKENKTDIAEVFLMTCDKVKKYHLVKKEKRRRKLEIDA